MLTNLISQKWARSHGTTDLCTLSRKSGRHHRLILLLLLRRRLYHPAFPGQPITTSRSSALTQEILSNTARRDSFDHVSDRISAHLFSAFLAPLGNSQGTCAHLPPSIISLVTTHRVGKSATSLRCTPRKIVPGPGVTAARSRFNLGNVPP